MDWSARQTRNTGIAILGLSALFFAIDLVNRAPPPRSDLTELAGQLRYVEKVMSKQSLSAVRFALASDPRHFQYVSNAGATHQVLEALERAGEGQISVAFDSTHSHTPWFEDRALYTVYDLAMEGRPVRTYAQVVSSWTAKRSLGRWVAYGSAAGGLLVFVMHFRARSGV